MEEVHKKIKLTQWGSQILTWILTSQMMVTKNPQNVHIESIFGQFWWPSYLTSKLMSISVNLIVSIYFFRWFKFTLKPPNSITHGNLLLAIWDTSHWNFFVKFGLKTTWHISYDILWSLLSYVNFWQLQGRLSTFAKIWGPQKMKVFSMKEWSVVDEAWGF